MGLDPAITLAKGAGGGGMRQAQRIADLERRISTLERQTAAVSVASGIPSTVARPGTLVLIPSNAPGTRLMAFYNSQWNSL